MSTPKQKRAIFKYYITQFLFLPCLLMIFISTGVSIVLITIDGALLHHLNPPLITILLPQLAAVFYGVLGIYSFLTAFYRERSKKWNSLIEEITANRYVSQYKFEKINDDPAAAAEFIHLDLAPAKKLGFLLLILPIILQILCFIPQLVISHNALEAQKDHAAAIIQQLEDTFAPHCESTLYNDPHEHYHSIGYDYCAYLPESDGIDNRSIKIRVGNDGKISGIAYRCDVNVHLTKDENITIVKETIQTLHALFLSSGLTTATAAPMEIDDLSPEFWTAFREGSYYEALDMDAKPDDQTTVSYCYDTREEDKFDQYYSPKVSLSIAIQNNDP